VTTEGRRPIEVWEREHLARLGTTLKAARLQGGLTVQELAHRADLSARHLHRLERGERRTRSSTLHRLAHVLSPGDSDRLVEDWLAIVGMAVAPESRFAARVVRRRQRRIKRKRKAIVQPENTL
jgi:transcriptional regulator with XRE-family HTH domain